MSQIITTPDGVEHEFPDGTADDVIKSTLGKSYPPQSPAGAPPTPAGALPAGASAAGTPAGSNQPQPASAPDSGAWLPQSRAELMARLARPLQGAGQAANDYARIASNAFTFGGADRLASAMPTSLGGTGRTYEQEQQETKDAWKRVGAMGYPVAAAGYMANPVSDIGMAGQGLSMAGRAGMMALEGGISGGATEGMQGKSIPGGVIAGAVTNPIVGGALGLGSKLAGAVKPLMPTSEGLHDAADQLWNMTAKANLALPDLQAISRHVQYGAVATGRPSTKAVPDLIDDITKSAEPGGIAVKDMLSFQDRANALKGNDAQYGQMISKHIEDAIQAHPQADGINSARAADVFANAFDAAKDSPPETAGQTVANYIHSHAFWLAHQVPHVPYVPHAALFLGGLPILSSSSGKIGDILAAKSTEEAQRALTGTQIQPNVPYSDAIRKLIYGGGLATQQ